LVGCIRLAGHKEVRDVSNHSGESVKRFWVGVGGLIILALGLFNLLLLNQNRTLQARFNGLGAQPDRPTDQALLWLTSANSPIGQLTLIRKGEESYQPLLSLLVFLSQQDCHACLEEAEVWQKLYK